MKKIILKFYIDVLRYMYREDLQLIIIWLIFDIVYVVG